MIVWDEPPNPVSTREPEDHGRAEGGRELYDRLTGQL